MTNCYYFTSSFQDDNGVFYLRAAMRKKIVAGNWKMNLLNEEAIQLASEIVSLIKRETTTNAELILAPPFVHLTTVIEITKNESRIAVASQNCSDKNAGAYTGEVSAAMIKSVGASAVIIGHSERRAYYHETDLMLADKVKQALTNNLQPIFCCGETLAQRESNKHFDVIKEQLTNGLFHLNENDFSKTVIAYEPVWAIGTGVTASPEQAQEIHKYIRNLVAEHYNITLANETTILYGGSCNEKNAKELFALPDVDGGLIGGASLKAESFVSIGKSFPSA